MSRRSDRLWLAKLAMCSFANDSRPDDSRWLKLLRKYMRKDISAEELAELECIKASNLVYQDQFDRFTDPEDWDAELNIGFLMAGPMRKNR